MVRTQTLVQLSDELLARLDSQAARTGRSRSELIREAITGYLDGDRQALLDKQLVDGYTRVPQDAEEFAWGDAATRAMLAAAGPWEDDPA